LSRPLFLSILETGFKAGIDGCMAASASASGIVLRSINKAGRVWSDGFSPKVIWGVVKQKAKGCEIPALAPHDLRRTCARLCHQAGGELEQIQFLLGPVAAGRQSHHGHESCQPQGREDPQRRSGNAQDPRAP
jgi:hypothetical protein